MKREIKEPKRRATSLRMEAGELKRVKRVAVESDRTMVELMREWIGDGLEKAEGKLARKRAATTAVPAENTPPPVAA